jgi:acyl-CoA synthetase (AMP-forming)/AMP-acid ligase II
MDLDHRSTYPTSQQLDDIITRLTVMVGNAQLLERRILRGEPVSPDAILSVLSTIQRVGHQAAMDANRPRTAEFPRHTRRAG